MTPAIIWPPRVVGIIGGDGKMGRLFHKIFEDHVEKVISTKTVTLSLSSTSNCIDNNMQIDLSEKQQLNLESDSAVTVDQVTQLQVTQTQSTGQIQTQQVTNQTQSQQTSTISNCTQMTLQQQENYRIISQSDLIIFSLPLSLTTKIIRECNELNMIKPSHVLFDLSSLKVGPMKEMMRSKACTVIGGHPMWGPAVGRNIQGQKFAFCFGRNNNLVNQNELNLTNQSNNCPIFRWFHTKIFKEKEGCQTQILRPAEHDRVMAINQSLVHFTNFLFVDTMRRCCETAMTGSAGSKQSSHTVSGIGGEKTPSVSLDYSAKNSENSKSCNSTNKSLEQENQQNQQNDNNTTINLNPGHDTTSNTSMVTQSQNSGPPQQQSSSVGPTKANTITIPPNPINYSQDCTNITNHYDFQQLQQLSNPMLSPSWLMQNLSTPVFRSQLLTAGRVLNQDPTLYRAIQFENPYFPGVLKQMQASFSELRAVVMEGQRKAFQQNSNSMQSQKDISNRGREKTQSDKRAVRERSPKRDNSTNNQARNDRKSQTTSSNLLQVHHSDSGSGVSGPSQSGPHISDFFSPSVVPRSPRSFSPPQRESVNQNESDNHDASYQFVQMFTHAGEFMGQKLKQRGHDAVTLYNRVEKELGVLE